MIQVSLLLFAFMAAIDITIVSTIMPHLIATLGDMQLYPLMSSAYLIAFFLAAPVFGKACDHFGCKKAIWIAMTLFIVGSLASGMAPSMKAFIVSRFVQVLGACGLTNIYATISARLYKKDEHRSLMQAISSLIWS